MDPPFPQAHETSCAHSPESQPPCPLGVPPPRTAPASPMGRGGEEQSPIPIRAFYPLIIDFIPLSEPRQASGCDISTTRTLLPTHVPYGGGDGGGGGGGPAPPPQTATVCAKPRRRTCGGRQLPRHRCFGGKGAKKGICSPRGGGGSRFADREPSPPLPAAHLPRECRCRSVNTPGPLIGGSLLSSGSWRRKERVESAFLGSGDPGRVSTGTC